MCPWGRGECDPRPISMHINVSRQRNQKVCQGEEQNKEANTYWRGSFEAPSHKICPAVVPV